MLGVLLAVVAMVGVVLFASVSSAEAKIVVGTFCPSGTEGGQCSANANRVAINNTGAGGVAAGTVYVTDAGNNRVQRLTAVGGFQRAWGFNVVKSGAPGDTGTGFEICTVAADCQAGTALLTTANGRQLNLPQGIVVSPATGHVYVLEANDRRVQEFDADGNFVRLWGWDVVSPGGVGDVSATAFEICTIASDCKTAGAAPATAPGSAAEGGRFGTTPRGLAFDSSNNVWVADSNARRVQKFDSNGNFVAMYGFNVNGGGVVESCTSTAVGVCKVGSGGPGIGQFGAGSPQFIAFDSANNLLANNGASGSSRRVERYSAPSYTSVATFGTAVPIPGGIINTDAILALPGDHLLITTNDGTERELHELDASGADVGPTSLDQTGITSINGLARNSTSGRIYLTTNNTAAGVLILDDGSAPPDPPMVVNPPTAVTGSSASFSGTIDPQGSTITSCNFQYSTDQTTWTNVTVAGCSTLTPGGGAQPVTANATGLTPNTPYFVRLTVNRLFVSGTPVSTAQSFTTNAVPPTVAGTGAVGIIDTSARLVAAIAPRNAETSYVIEYGTTPALGSTTDPVSVGSGLTPVIVSQVIDNLTPGTTYHYRFVATNQAGTTNGTTETFTTRTDPLPNPDNRAYEQVSPVDKNHGSVDSAFYAAAGVAPGGDAAGFCSSASIGDEPFATLFCAPYVSHRGADGWQTRGLVPRVCTGTNAIASLSKDFGQSVLSVEEEFDQCVLPRLAPAAQRGQNLYRQDVTAASSPFTLMTPSSNTGTAGFPNGGTANFIGASDDFDHVVYTSNAQQTVDAPVGNFVKVFDWHAGVAKLVSVDPGGVPFGSSSSVPTDGVNGVSADGDRIFFQSPVFGFDCDASNCEVYLRENGVATYDVSASECTSACGASAPDTFEWASADGGKAFFRTAAKLVDDDTQGTGEDLYRYTHSENPATDHNLAWLTKDNEPADGTSAGVRGVVGASDDGDTVFFAATGQIVAGEPTAAGPKLYRWRWNGGSPTIDYLATLGSAPLGPPTNPVFADRLFQDSFNWSAPWTGLPGPGSGVTGVPRARHVTGSGDVLTIQSTLQLDPVADRDSDRDVYRWTEAGGWVCVSCQVPGVESEGRSSIDGTQRYGDPPANGGLGTLNGELAEVMSNDGERVFFTSFDSLVPEDVNDGVQDVYQWHDGLLSLVSSGQSGSDDVLVGVSDDGRDVMFITRQRLVGWDTDGAGDLYDARIGGGFAEPPPTGAPCQGDGCQGTGAGEVSTPQSKTAGTGGGNAEAGSRAAISVGGLSLSQRKRAARTGRLVLSVRASKPGRVTAVAKARLGKRAETIAKRSLRLARAGKATLTLRLSRSARLRLLAGKSLAVSLRVSSPGARARAMTVRLPGVKS